MLCRILRYPVLRHIARKYIRNALLSHLPARTWHAFPDYRLCIVCCRRPESEVSAFERVFPHHLPFGTGSYHCYFLLQQYPVPAGTKYMHSLSETITMADPLAASKFSQSVTSGLVQGHGYAEATQMATTSLYNTLQQQSLLLALKEILGWLFIVTLVIAIISRFIPFHKTIKVTFAKTGDDMV